MKKRRILFLTPYPKGTAPSQRFRFELYYSYFDEMDIHQNSRSFLTINAWRRLYSKGKTLSKISDVFIGFSRRFFHCVLALSYDIVFIHRELTPIGPPVFEWWIAKVWRKKIIYDFDDAIWIPDGPSNSGWLKILKGRSKVASICRWSWKVSVGNNFLADFARQHGAETYINPTVVDTLIHTPKLNTTHKKLVVGWTGSHSTLFYLDSLVVVLQNLQEKYDFTFVVIANRDPRLSLKNYKFIKWQENTEVEDLSQIDIGLMPLENSAWAQGKCGFKLIQYGAIGIPSVASPVGVNEEVIQEGVTGFLALSQEEWTAAIEKLLLYEDLRKQMGRAARNHIVRNYSVEANKVIWDRLFLSPRY